MLFYDGHKRTYRFSVKYFATVQAFEFATHNFLVVEIRTGVHFTHMYVTKKCNSCFISIGSFIRKEEFYEHKLRVP
jgi:acetyltransferase-like isoleucine patch superfamily enzyme